MSFSGCETLEKVLGFVCTEWLTSIIDLTQDLETLWHNMHNKSCRYNVKRAEKAGVRVKINENHDEFYELYRSFVRSKRGMGLPPLWDDPKIIRDYCTLFTAMYGNELLGGNAYLEDDNSILFYITANKRFNTKNAKKRSLIGNASVLTQWEAMRYAKQRGLAEFDMGGLFAEKGGNYPVHPINTFKKHFGGKTVTRYHCYKDYSKTLALGRRIWNAKQRYIR